jgi:hypothetical protein
MAKANGKVPIFDLNFAAFQKLHGNSPELELHDSRVTFVFTPNREFLELSERYNSNEQVPVIDFVNATRQLRSMMLALKGKR